MACTEAGDCCSVLITEMFSSLRQIALCPGPCPGQSSVSYHGHNLRAVSRRASLARPARVCGRELGQAEEWPVIDPS